MTRIIHTEQGAVCGKVYANLGEQQIDYIIRANVIPVWFLAVAAAAVLIARGVTKKWSEGLLIGYILIILGETVIFRTPRASGRYELQLFWSYRVWTIQKEQILANIFAYIPIGLLAGRLWKWKGITAGIALSITSEILQLITHRGLFEFDAGEILGTTRLSPYKSRVWGL